MTFGENVGLLIARLTIGYLFLNAAWACGKDPAGRKWTIDETALLFPRQSRLLAFVGIAIMGLGGAGIVLGVFPRLAGLALAGFLVPGSMIHFIQRKRAGELQQAILGSVLPSQRGTFDEARLTELSVSATLGHYSSAMKNIALVGPTLLFALVGAGDWVLIDVNHRLELTGMLTP